MIHLPLRGVKYNPPMIQLVMMVGLAQKQRIVLCQRATHQHRILFHTRAK